MSRLVLVLAALGLLVGACADTVPEGTIRVIVDGIEDLSGGHVAGVLFTGDPPSSDTGGIGGFAARVDTDPFSATFMVRSPLDWEVTSAEDHGLFPDVTDEVLTVDPGVYTLVLWVAGSEITHYSRWVPAAGPLDLAACQTIFEVEEGSGASLAVIGGFDDVSEGVPACTLSP